MFGTYYASEKMLFLNGCGKSPCFVRRRRETNGFGILCTDLWQKTFNGKHASIPVTRASFSYSFAAAVCRGSREKGMPKHLFVKCTFSGIPCRRGTCFSFHKGNMPAVFAPYPSMTLMYTRVQSRACHRTKSSGKVNKLIGRGYVLTYIKTPTRKKGVCKQDPTISLY